MKMNNTRILIVEDEPILAFSLRIQLQRSGYEVIGIADSSYEALQYVERDRPDLILMDYYIRGAMNGIDTAQIIQIRHMIPVIFLSSLEDEDIIRQIRTMRYCGFRSKPVDIEELKRAIDRKVKRVRPERELLPAL
jgi:DNA-binding NarL/FixJ family response regulator